MLRRWLPFFVFAFTLLLYLRTLVPDIFVSDFVEFQYQPALGGLPHPNGFPLYMLLGWLWSHLPVGTMAWRMNALSAIFGALAVALTAAFAQRLSGRTAVGLLAAGLLALSTSFWYYSLAAERYTLNMALLAAVFWTMWEAGRRATSPDGDPRRAEKLAYLSGLLLGLGLAVHPSDVLLGPFWLGYLAWRLPDLRRQPRFWLVLAIISAAPLLLFLYVPLRWQAFSGWPLLPGVDRSSAVYQGLVHVWYEPEMTLDLLRAYVLGLGGYASKFVLGGWRDALAGTWVLEPYWSNNVAPVVLALAGLGLLRLLRRDAALALVLAGFGVFVALMTAYITQGKNDAYLMPTFWVIFFCAAFSLDLALAGLSWLGRWRRQQPAAVASPEPAPAAAAGAGAASPLQAGRLSWIAGAAVVVLLGALVWSRYPESNLSRWTDTRRDWEVTLAHPLDDGAALLGHWSDFTPLWYMQQIEGRRPDLVGLFPPDPATVIQPWLDSSKPLYLAAPLNEYAPDLGQRYQLVPWGKLVRILPRGQDAACPPQGNSVETPAAWPFTVTSWQVDDQLAGDVPGTLRFCWQARSVLPPDTFVSLRLRWQQGERELNVNQPLLSEWLPSTTIPAGEDGLAVVPVRLPFGTPIGSYTMELEPYRLRGDGVIERWPGVEPIVLGETAVAPPSQFRSAVLTDETAPSVPLRAGPLALRAWHVSDLPVRPGDPIELEFLWEVVETPSEPLSLSIGFWRLPGAQPVQVREAPLVLPDSLGRGLLIRTVHSVPVPRGRGDETYWIQPQVQMGDERLAWLPTGALFVGRVRVQDRPHVDQPPASAVAPVASFGALADLAWTRLEPAAPKPGDALVLTLYWQPQVEIDRNYSVFVHLVDAAGQIVAQNDSAPANGMLPTSIWLPREIIEDRHILALPADLPAGDYTLRVGLYDSTTGERVPVSSSQPVEDNALLLAPLQVAP